MSMFIQYIKNKWKQLLMMVICLLSSGVVLFLSGTRLPNLVLADLLVLLWYGIYIGWRYDVYKKESLSMQKIMKDLDRRYLAHELLKKPQDIETIGYYELLRCANRDMCNRISQNNLCLKEYRELTEEWIHELKTPLTSLELMSSGSNQTDISYEVERMKYILDKCLNYIRLDSLEKDYHVEDIPVTDVIHELLMEEKNAIREKKLGIEVNISNNCYVKSDKKWVRFMFQQFLNNAIKYSSVNGKLIFCEKTIHNIHWIGLQDTGCGIAAEDMPRIWEKGFTGSTAYRDSASGIGLYLVKRCADQMNIKLDCQSKCGKGSLFELGFPNAL